MCRALRGGGPTSDAPGATIIAVHVENASFLNRRDHDNPSRPPIDGAVTVPKPLVPMKATAGRLPTDEGWAFEIKWDGMRVVANIDPDASPAVRLTSSTGKDAGGRFPEFQELIAATGGVPSVLDGEAVAFDDLGRSDFGLLQSRLHAAEPTPIHYVVFDVLAVDGQGTMALPFRERREILAELLVDGTRWTTSSVHHGDGADLLEAARAQGLEGLVAKRWDSAYRPDSRSKAWRKVKIRRRQELVVGGWTPGVGNRATTLGSLLVGYHAKGELRFAGRVGTGFAQRELLRLLNELSQMEQPTTPFVDLPTAVERDAHHVAPLLVVEVEFAEWTADGVLRHPAYAGQRIDVDPASVRREPDPA
jgi:bifunctional non-homologous end joining protein LigD